MTKNGRSFLGVLIETLMANLDVTKSTGFSPLQNRSGPGTWFLMLFHY